MRIDSFRTLVLALVLTAGVTVVEAATVELVSRADPLPDSNGNSLQPALSADGRYAAFVSDAPNLAPGQVDDNAAYDVFLHDRLLGTTVLVSHAAGSPNRAAPLDQVTAESLESPSISADGRYVAFTSLSTGIVPGVTEGNFSRDVFLYDRVTGVNTLVSHAAGTPGITADGRSGTPWISADGSYVAFTSNALNLVTGQNEPAGIASSVFLWSRASNTATLISRKSGTTASEANGGSIAYGISADGDFVLFTSAATDLLPTVSDGPSSLDVFIYQRSSNAVFLVSRASGSPTTAAGADAAVIPPVLSADGRYVAFTSRSTNLVPGQVDGDFAPDAFLFDRVSGEMRLASRTSASPQTAGGLLEFVNRGFSMSADGRYVAFVSRATNLVPGQVDTNAHEDVFVYDRITGTTALASHTQGSATTATPDPVGASSPSFSADGRFLAFESGAVDLVAGQTDIRFISDVFLYDQTSGRATLVSHTRGSATTAVNGFSVFPVISADGGVVAFTSLANNLGEGQADPNGYIDLFLYHRSSGDIASASRRDPDLPIVTPIGASSARAISADGRFILFLSRAPGLVPGQLDYPSETDEPGELTSGTIDVFLRDQVAGQTTLLSRLLSSPLQTAGGRNPVITPDGRFAAFTTASLVLGIGPLYLYDRMADSLTLVNHVPGNATQADNGYPRTSSISADGRFLAYECLLCGLVPGHSTSTPSGHQAVDVFLYDRTTGMNTLVSHASGSSSSGGDGPSGNPRISANGRFVVFSSEATNLVAGQNDTTGTQDLFVFDRTNGSIALVSRTAASATTAAGGLDAFAASGLSDDGRFIAFASSATNLVPRQVDTNENPDLFLHDRVAGTTVLVSHTASSPVTGGNGQSFLSVFEGAISISADGRFLAYDSLANNLVAGLTDANSGSPDVFLYDRLAGTNTLVSHAAGAPLRTGNGFADTPRISADGSRIAFLSAATDLLPGQTVPAGMQNLYVRDRSTGTTVFIGRTKDVNDTLVTDGFRSYTPQLSVDGRRIAFTSDAAFVAGDLNRNLDVYLWKDGGGTPGGPIPLPTCKLLDTRRRADRPVLTSNVQRAVTVRGACGVPATAKQVVVKVTALAASGKGNLRFYSGAVTATPSGILRFERNATRTETFTLPLSPNGTLTVLPFVAGRGTVHVAVEVTGYSN